MDQKNNTLSVPMAILGAGILIAGALFFSQKTSSPSPNNVVKNNNSTSEINLKAVSSTDHILGDPNAPVVVVEYSDLECYYCKMFQPTAERLIEEYGKKGQIAWVYRQFPLVDLHPRAKKAAIAAECIAELGGNAKFWSFVQTVFKNSEPSNGSLEKLNMSEIAKSLGIDQKAFDTCAASTKYDEKIQDYTANGVKAGINGTPGSFMVLKTSLKEENKKTILEKTADYLDPQGRRLINVSSDGKTVSLNGALPYEIFKSILDLALDTK